MTPLLLAASPVARVLELLRAGRPVLVYDADGREEETDLFLPAQAITPAGVRMLRRDAGGLVFLAVDAPVAHRFGIPFLQDVYAAARREHPVLDALAPGRLPYDARSSFALTLNHRRTFTGITDRDRALTIRRFAELASEVAAARLRPEAGIAALGAEFRTPGHVHLCAATEPLLQARRGHTELGVALARMAGITPVVAGAEMLDPGPEGDRGAAVRGGAEGTAAGSGGGADGALSRRGAETWARRHGTVVVDGDAVAEAWASFIRHVPHGTA